MARTLIVAVRDPESARPALARTFRLARAGDRVVLAHARRRALLDLLGAGTLRAAAPEIPVASLGGDDWLDALRSTATPPSGVALEAELIDGEAAPGLAALAQRLGAAAIVAAPARRGALREFALGSTLMRLLRESALPVVVARDEGAAAWHSAAAAVTGDPSGLRVAGAALAFAPDAALTLVHAWRVPDEGRLRLHAVEAAHIAAVRDWTRGAAEGALADVRRLAPSAAMVLCEGHAASALLDWGRQARPDVLFVAAHRGAASQERLLGSVTQFLLYHWPGDLVLVP